MKRPDLTNNYILSVYNSSKSCIKAAERLGICASSVCRRLKDSGVLLPRNTVNHSFFSNDTPESFYWAGFIAADGCVQLHSQRSCLLAMDLAKKDENHLSKFKSAINFSGRIEHWGAEKDVRAIRIWSVNIYNDLARFGIVPRKSLVLKFPSWLENHLLVHHFMRGYFDGDGSVGVYRNPNSTMDNLCMNLCGTKEFLTIFRNILDRNNCTSHHNVKIYKRPDNKIHLLAFKGNRNCAKIRDLMYKDSTPETRLDRKHNIFFNPLFVDMPDSFRYKSVVRVDHNSGEEKQYEAAQLTKEDGFFPSLVGHCCRGERKTHGGFMWRFEKGNKVPENFYGLEKCKELDGKLGKI